MVQTRAMQRKSGGAICGDFVPQRRRTQQRIAVREVNSETILRDAIDDVCKFLNMKDLHAVSQVCSYWKAAAAREVTKRRQIQRLLIPHNLDDIANSNAIYHIPGALHVKPSVALLFVGSKLIEEFNFGRLNSLTHEGSSARTLALPMDKNFENCFLSSVFDVYKQQLPHNLVGMEVCEYLTDNDIFMSKDLKKQVALEAAGSQSILGLFLPSGKGMDVRVSWCEGLGDDLTIVADRMIDQLTIVEDQPQNHRSTILIFAQSLAGYFLAEQVIYNVQQRYPNRDEHVWGGIIGKELGATNCHENDSSIDGKKIFVGLRITSPGLKTWMTVLDCSATRDEIAQRLHEFKEQVHPKRHTVGLAYGPKYIQPRRKNNQNLYHEAQDVMRAIKDVFTDIQFSGIFNHDSRILISHNAIHEEMSQKMNRKQFMALIVIAYD